MFYSHPSQPLEFILFAVLSTHFLLHQYFISSFPPFLLFFYLLFFTSFLFFFPVLFFLSCTVADIYNPSDLLSFSLKNFFTFSILSSLPPPLFSFSSFIWSLLCFTRAPLLGDDPEVPSADELKLFVVGGVELFPLLLLSLMGLRSDTLSGPGAFTIACKRNCCCAFSRAIVTAERGGSSGLNLRLILLFDPVELCSQSQQCPTVLHAVDLNSWFCFFWP